MTPGRRGAEAGRGRRGAARVAGALVLALVLGAPPGAWAEGPAPEAGPYATLGLTLPKEHLPAPGFRLEAVNGGATGLSERAGRWVLVNFWATWCKPCVKELPALERLSRDYAERRLAVLAVNVDRGRRRHVARYAERLGLTLPVLLDRDGAVRRAYEVRALPTTYLVGPDGRIAGRVLGDVPWDDADHRAAWDALLGAGTPPPPTQ